jgi:hypothetical protein
MRFLISLTLMLQPLTTFGQINQNSESTIHTGSLEYSAQQLARPETYSSEERQIAALVSPVMKENLRAAFILAQQKFISADINKMASYWLDVVSYSLKADWDRPEREIISFSYLRLAQISQNTDETKKYITDAAIFDSTYVPNIHLLPPPIVEQFKLACRSINKVKISTNHLKEFSFALINGQKQKITTNKPLILNVGLLRFTLISSTHQPVTRVLFSGQLENFKPTLTPRQLPTLASLRPKTEDYIGAREPINNLSSTRDKTDYTFYKKQNFWLGMALITATAVAITRQNNQKEVPAATHREGL